MYIAIGSDHRGVALKEYIIGLLKEKGHQLEDFGAYNDNMVDYPDIAFKVGESVAKRDNTHGILICGTGIGMSIAANKVNGIRAAHCVDTFDVHRCREHNDANIICLGAERGFSNVPDMLEDFLTTGFSGGRHQNRVDKMMDYERQS